MYSSFILRPDSSMTLSNWKKTSSNDSAIVSSLFCSVPSLKGWPATLLSSRWFCEATHQHFLATTIYIVWYFSPCHSAGIFCLWIFRLVFPRTTVDSCLMYRNTPKLIPLSHIKNWSGLSSLIICNVQDVLRRFILVPVYFVRKTGMKRIQSQRRGLPFCQSVFQLFRKRYLNSSIWGIDWVGESKQHYPFLCSRATHSMLSDSHPTGLFSWVLWKAFKLVGYCLFNSFTLRTQTER